MSEDEKTAEVQKEPATKDGSPKEDMTLEEAMKRLKKMTDQRDALTVAISEYKRFIQKLVGKL